MLVLLIIYFILVSNCLATNKIEHYNEYVSSQLNTNTNINTNFKYIQQLNGIHLPSIFVSNLWLTM